MTNFTTRVELHNADEDDYETLHEAMEAEGFTRTIRNSDDKLLHLPTAEYNYSGNSTRSVVLDKAKSAAKKTNCAYEVLVTESAGRTWYNLSDA